MIVMESNWDKPEIIRKVKKRRTSATYFDNLEVPTGSHDNKNMRIVDRSRYKDTPNVN